MTEGEALLPFDQTRQQIEAGAARILGGAPEGARNAPLPSVSLKRGETSVEMAFAALAANDFFTVVEVCSSYFKELGPLRRGYLGAIFAADLMSGYERRRAEEKKIKEKAPAPPPPLTVKFQLSREGKGTIELSKEGNLGQEEVNAALELFGKLALRADGTGAGDPAKRLEELGAVVFQASPEWTEDRIAGYEGVKREVENTVVLPLLHPEMFVAVAEAARTRKGSSVPRAVLFEGPPGTGKTTMARILASRSGVSLVYVPLESIMSKWFGDSERRLDAIFDLAGKLGKVLVFLDEIDAFAGSREGGQMHEATRRILSVLLRQLQGLVDASSVVVIGATNRKQDLDPALLSRFTRSIYFPLPNVEERVAILGYYAKHLGEAERRMLADVADGRSGRELEDACGTAERLWASELIAARAAPSAPPVDRYAHAFHLKFGHAARTGTP
jgi:hypothetical protein